MELFEVKRSILREIYKKRDPWSRKYNFGHLLVIGGSRDYSGSPAFNALAALRAGVDLVTIVAPERAANIIASFKPDLIAYPLRCEYFSVRKLKEVLKFVERKDAIVIGGGMTRSKKVVEFVLEFLKNVEIPCVVDADAIHALAKDRSVVEGKKVVITPHSYEFFILSGERVSPDLQDRVDKVRDLANEMGCVILLKGHVDVISDGSTTAINRTGSPYMTKGGMGDTLAGICGAYLARNTDPFKAACAAAWVNGKAGELAAEGYKEGVMASDLIEEIPNVIK